MKNYKAIGKIGEGTFSEVMKMQSLRDGNYYACKQMKQHFDSIDQVNSLREIQALRRLNPHPNILTLYEVVFDRKSGSLALICELMDMNIYELIRGRRHPLSERRIMHYMYQLCKSLDHMHRNGIFHRDVKPENILIKQDVLKLGDFGSCRSVYSKQPYTEYISTRWYRAPECLLTDGFYTYKMDLWSAGCVFYEIASLQPLFPGDNELDQISKIHDVIGTPAQRTLTKFKQSRAMSFDFPFKKGSGIPPPPTNLSPHCLSLLHAMVVYDPDDRIAAHQALQHPYFQEQRGAEARALVSHRRAFFPARPAAPEPLGHRWHSREARKQQKQPARPEEDHARRAAPDGPVELPRLRLSAVSRLSPCVSPALRPALGAGADGRVPVLLPLKCVSVSKKTDPQKDVKAALKHYRLPTITRKGGGC
ncbi:MAPK/MAK/MRK overlapping kinase isoform X2 [Dipodomys merriami]|uniref:MAPK/MAK/MRK overlapping kinase isoform X2 n=1 Tax=Dipodomys merriami TaxID=94247 RepID=UPI0038558ECE